jgi:hypothetical protein
MAALLSFIARGKRWPLTPLPPAKIKMLQRWFNEDWESHDLDSDLVKVVGRLLLAIQHRDACIAAMRKRK